MIFEVTSPYILRYTKYFLQAKLQWARKIAKVVLYRKILLLVISRSCQLLQPRSSRHTRAKIVCFAVYECVLCVILSTIGGLGFFGNSFLLYFLFKKPKRNPIQTSVERGFLELYPCCFPAMMD